MIHWYTQIIYFPQDVIVLAFSCILGYWNSVSWASINIEEKIFEITYFKSFPLAGGNYVSNEQESFH